MNTETVTPEIEAITFSIMDRTGDSKLIFDINKPDEVDAARAMFNTLVKEKRYLAFRATDKDGSKGDQIKEFDPKAGTLIMVPMMVGG